MSPTARRGNRKPVYNPEAYCPVCAKRVGRAQEGHRCSDKVLAAIDAADTRAGNADAEADDDLGHPGNQPSLETRLTEGFRMLRAGGDRE